MYPILFTIFGVEARSYYVLWAFALYLFLRMSYRRCTLKYGADPHAAGSLLLTVYCWGILGAILGGAAEKLPLIFLKEQSVKALFSGGASSGFGIMCGGIAGIYKSGKVNFSLEKFAAAVSLSLALMLAAGRIGCLLEGCCAGITVSSDTFFALHFPQDPQGVLRFPSQLLESAVCLGIFVLLYITEKRQNDRYRAETVLFPLFLLLYGTYRLIFDAYRETSPNAAFESSRVLACLAVIMALCRLCKNVRKKK